jgi:DNA-binding MarR family transcriptional regulator
MTRGLAVSTIDLEDRHHVKLLLTAEGNALLDATFGDIRRWKMKRFAPLSAGEIQGLTRLMESLRKIV